MSKKIAVIIGSSRPGRIGANITHWVVANLPKNDDITYEVIDLAEQNLPMFDEAMPPMMMQYQNEHTKQWSAKISEYSGFVFVTPEYNAGYPAVLKNAIDYLLVEWKAGVVTIVSYGWSGGASANHQLKEVFERIGSKITKTLPQVTLTKESFGEDHQIKDIDTTFAAFAGDITKAGEELISAL